ncbi:hypothetical protein HO173_012115 [Letharia columbiana]|uniref:Uncharacterized protein n=1 Tax=Letharia columbiana TaxID=112416 RepID=A0A8H6FGT1_9LECA|nr:uncharacterized protein HO173_012115 [Letharia columbiana]KAF6227586.1 hypothetical protein HO173_012115 [Letharia columbiana]
MSQKRILVIADSDSSGVSGLEADQKVIAAHGCYAVTATTALTAHGPGDVLETCSPSVAFVKAAIDGCFDGGGVEVVKIGFLASAEIVQIVVDALRRHGPRFVVVDPVVVSMSGTQLLSDEARQYCYWIRREPFTNRISAIWTTSLRLAKALHSLGPDFVLLKGGQLPLTANLDVPKHDSDKQVIVDVLYDGTDVSLIKTAYVGASLPLGVEYAFASAIASNLVLGDAVPLATRKACRYVEAGISKGKGLIDYFHSTYTLPFSPRYFIEYLLNREDVKPVWHAHVHHDFVKRIGDGTLPVEKFKGYLAQDYLFLVQFARAKALSAYKTNSMEDIAAGAEEILHIQREMSLHLDYCAEFGLSKKEVEKQEEHQACTAYTRYVLDIAHSESWFALQMAFAPCLLGYGIIARRLWDDPETVKEQGNRYWKWIQNYVADDYRAAVEAGEAILEQHASLQSPSQIESLVKIFIHATKMETGFWDMGNE